MQRAHGDTSMADKKNDGKMVDRGGVPTFIVEMRDDGSSSSVACQQKRRVYVPTLKEGDRE